MAATVVDLRKYAGEWIAQTADGEVVAHAGTLPQLAVAVRDAGIDLNDVALTQVPKEDGTLLL